MGKVSNQVFIVEMRTDKSNFEDWLAEHDKEIRNDFANTFAECLKNSLLNNYRHLVTTDTDGFEWLTVDAVETHIDEVVKQMLND